MSQLSTVLPKSLDLSVVIPSYNDRGHLGDLLSALMKQQPSVKEIIVSHSGEGDPSVYCPTGDLPVRLLHQDEPLKSGAARNRGSAIATARWLAFLDDDVIPAENWSARLAQTHEMSDEHLCYVGSIDADDTGGYWGMCLWFVEFGSVHSYLPSRPIEGGASANMFLCRTLFDAAGGFPEHVDRSVDVEFLARCRQAGGVTLFERSVRVAHRNVGGLRHCLTHCDRLGRGSARVRQFTELKGSLFVKLPLLIPLMAPMRFAMISYRIGRWGKGVRLTFLWHLPGIFLALGAWTVGFQRGVRATRHLSRVSAQP